jgi:predicted metal-dependent hydrolase
MVEKESLRMGLYPSRISFRKARSRWGSCSTANAISFNYLMMKLPRKLIEYIIIHELAHIEHKHHQKAFWELVGRYCPDHRSRRNELKTYM